MIDARKLRHASKGHFNFPHIGAFQGIRNCGEIILNGSANILESFVLGRSLRPATWKGGTADGVAFFRLNEDDGVTKTHQGQRKGEREQGQGTQANTAKIDLKRLRSDD